MKQDYQCKYIHILILFAGSLLFSSCEIINPEEDIPSYLHIPSYSLISNFDQGTASHNITDAWVYLNDDIQGIYELPVTFPVLASGNQKLTIRPGIKINGIASTRIAYPFYTETVLNVSLTPAVVDTLLLSTTYKEATKFAWIEDFERPGLSIESLSFSDTALMKTDDPEKVYEGISSGRIVLDESRKAYHGISVNAFKLPGGLTPTYLELDFKTDHPFVVGLIANASGSTNVLEILVLNITDEWKKVYVNVGATVSRQSGVSNYKVYFRANLESGYSEAEILIDNLKLVHF